MFTISPMRVLVVDDNDDAAISLAMLLKRLGHHPAVAEGGEAALQQAPVFRPEAMFIDLAMPEVDGLTVARRLRQTSEFVQTPLVAVSGYVDSEHRARATEAGFTEFLAKPYPLAELQVTLARVRTRIDAATAMAQTARRIAEQSRRLGAQSRQGLDECWRSRVPAASHILVSVEKSGISYILSVSERLAADELHRWLKNQRCRIGPVFEPVAGRFAFFVYTRRHLLGDLIGKHGDFLVQ